MKRPSAPGPVQRAACRRIARGLALALALAVASAPCLRPVAAQGSPLPGAGQCMAQWELGPCLCGPVPCGVLVQMNVPLAVGEIVRAPGDTLLPGSGPTGPSTVSSSLSSTDNTAEARVWAVNRRVAPLASCFAPCVPEPLPDAAQGAGIDPAADSTGDAADGAPPPCPLPFALGGIVAAIPGLAALPALTLAYDSASDFVPWHTGCRDFSRALHGAACASDPLLPQCLGVWGPLLPRQMRDIGPDPLLHSAKTAIRAMSLAHDPFATLEVAPGVGGLLQQALPRASDCFPVGLPLPRAPLSLRPPLPSRDGRIAWLYWHPALCCLSPSQLASCAAFASQ